MVNTVFVSPGIISSEKVYNAYASKVGKTKMGVVGTTLKGPAFQPTKISSTDEYTLRFGLTNSVHPMSYVAHSFLEQSNNLNVTRVLGLEGYTNSPAWIVVASSIVAYTGSNDYNEYVFSTINGDIFSYVFSIFSDDSLGDGTLDVNVSGNNINIGFSGSVTTDSMVNALTASTAFTELNIFIFGGPSSTLIADADQFTLGVTFVGPAPNANCWLWGSENITFEELNIPFGLISDSCGFPTSGATVAVLRSKKNPLTGEFYYKNQTDVKIGNTAGTLQPFMLSAATGPFTAYTNSGITVSLDETREDYIVKSLGTSSKWVDGASNLYVERIYPNFIRESAIRGLLVGVYEPLMFIDQPEYTNFRSSYTHAITPWIVSRVIGKEVKRLFRFHTVSDGDSSNEEIKISILNLDPDTNSFDILVRDFYDLDSDITSLERFSNVCLDETASNFIGKIIGTKDGNQYPNKSKFIEVEMADGFISNTLPSGFEGYFQKTLEVVRETDFLPPLIYYKTNYLDSDSISKTFLGISELAYSGFSASRASRVRGINRLDTSVFSYIGTETTGLTKTKGFHLENIANEENFFLGDKNSLTAYTTTNGLFLDKQKLKFTICPAGGFDGWDITKYYEFNYEQFKEPQLFNIEAFKQGIDTMQNPDEVDINVLATPGIDFYNNSTLVNYTIDKVENRADVFYIIDAPRITVGDVKGTTEELISNLKSTGFDTSYAATYWPWLQIQDPNTGKYSYQAPTFMAAKCIARTDKVSNQWHAPAGMNRGSGGGLIIKTDINLSKSEKDSLYTNRINPITKFSDDTIAIFGQKTMQVRQTSLDRINVRRLLLQLRKIVSLVSASLVFEQNDQKLRDQFKAKIEPILSDIKNKGGMYGYRIMINKPKIGENITEENTLTGIIQIQPSRIVEYIDLTFELFPTGAKFENF